MDIRNYRRYRKQGFPPNASRYLTIAGKLLLLRLTLQELLKSGEVPPGAVKKAFKKALST